MLNKLKTKIDQKKQEKAERKRQFREQEAALNKSMKKNRAMVKARQTESLQDMKCPLCQGDKFFRNIRLAYLSFVSLPLTEHLVSLSVQREEGMSARDKSDDGQIPLNTYVCKKCGNIILKMNFDYLDDSSFRGPSFLDALGDPVDWDI